MEKVIDIRPIKKQLRADCKQSRKNMNSAEKETYDKKIKNKLLNLFIFRDSQTVLTYVSTDIEVDTRGLLEELFKSKKTVAVPRCENKDGDMAFYIIKSFDDLESGYCGVLEPIPQKCEILTEFENSVCIVPAFLFDKKGYRLGYGKGYYDRFLAKYTGITVGICYDNNITDSLFHGKYDRTVNMIVTDKRIIDNRLF